MDEKIVQRNGTVDGNIVGILCYLGGILSALLLIVLEKENKFVRFHAIQSAITFVSIFVIAAVITVIPFIGWVLSPIVWLLGILVLIFLMFKAYQGEKYKLPVIGDFAEQQIGR